MKNKLNVFSNDKIKSFLKTFLSKYELNFMNLEAIVYDKKNVQMNIVILSNVKELDLIEFSKLSDNFLIISNLKNINYNSNNKVKILNTPTSINRIKNSINNFIQNTEIQFHDISIDSEKLINLNNKSFCYLTKIELEILRYLIREKASRKKIIKENILNIKSNIDTNSLESHLSRIRKKLNKIETVVKIQTKGEKLLITV
tara:strand:- start:12 stop:614 length:603 start_codon:yes stop_codon:yes gene_type:complete